MYTTLENITKRIPEQDVIELTSDDGGAVVDEETLDQAILDSETQVNSKLRGRYPVPVSAPIPAQIEQIATIITIHNLYSRKHQLTMSDGLARQYKKAMKDLDELQSGAQVLEGFEQSSSHPSFIAVNKTTEDRVFSKSVLNQMP